MGDDSWHEIKPKKQRKFVSVSESEIGTTISGDNTSRRKSSTFSNSNHRNQSLNSETCTKKKGNIQLLLQYVMCGSIEELVNDKLKSFEKCTIDGQICKLWDCIFHQFKKMFVDNTAYCESCHLRDSVELEIRNKKKNSVDDAMEVLCKKFQFQLKIFSVDKNVKDIIYGTHLMRMMEILHVGLDNFFPIAHSPSGNKYEFSTEDKNIMSSINQIGEAPVNRSNLKKEQNDLQKYINMLKGLEKKDEYMPTNVGTNKAGMKYDIYTDDQLDKLNNLITCELKLKNAHSGIAIPIDRTSDIKFKQIKLNNRRNCGYNAFQDDIVYVKINDAANHTGKVMGVQYSNHKPVYTIYICKVSRDQGTLMIPLSKFIPKIHVDNEAGRRCYEQNRQNKPLLNEQKSAIDIEKESRKYADNLFYTTYKLSVDNRAKMPILGSPQVKEFNPETCEFFFIVLYERWDPHFLYPHGKIIGTLSSYDTLTDNFHLISSLCNIRPVELTQRYKREFSQIERKSKNLAITNLIPSYAIIFTIDNETTEDMDDAISYHKEGNDTVIGIHISDVTKYVSSTHEIYDQAKIRFCTTYPPKFSKIKPIHIFGDNLGTDVFSLVPNKPRAVVSVLFRFSDKIVDGNINLKDICKPTIKDGVICSKYKLNYPKVSHWLRQSERPPEVDEDLFIALKETYEISKKLRRARLPESYFVRQVHDNLKEYNIDNQFEAEMLIEEFMLLANEHVAKTIYEKYPSDTLLRIQEPVRSHEEWVENLFKLTNMNFAAKLKEYCNLLKVPISDSGKMKSLIVSKRFYNKFCEFLGGRDTLDKARNLLQYDDYFNDFLVHIIEWYRLSSSARYECSIEGSVDNEHFSLQKPLYTHFTSPIRRFTDVIVHRLLKSVISGVEIDDITLDINEVCEIGNKRTKENKTFEKICAPFAIFDEAVKKYCFILDCVCSEINNDEIQFVHPMLQKAESIKAIKFSVLSLDEVPLSLLSDEKVERCTLKWEKLIFTCPPNNVNTSNSNRFLIDNHVFDCKLPHSASKLFREIRRSYLPSEELKDKLLELKSKFLSSTYDEIISSDSNSVANPVIKIMLELFLKNTMRIQFCKYKMNGLQKISPELYIVTPTFEICLIHKDDPVRFFIPGGKLNLKHNDIKKEFSNIQEYKEYFTPLIHIESLAETLSESPAFTLLNVSVRWIVCSGNVNGREIYGVILLALQFCRTRNIIFNDEKEEMCDRYEYLIKKGITSVGGDLLCLRHKKKNWENYWVGHGEIVNVGACRMNGDIFKVLVFRLTQSDFDCFSNETEGSAYSIDVFKKSIVSKRQEEAVQSIDRHQLLQEVILGIQVTSRSTNEKIINQIQNHIQEKKIFKLNSNQKAAMDNALNQKLSLIWGPPGTGKTHIGCILSYSFSFKNRLLNNGGVVLYCGPSNDCVNLVALEMRRKFNDDCPNILRIFGEQQELIDFPLPGLMPKSAIPLTEEMKEISLHHLIRQPGNTYADALKKYDAKFADILSSRYTNHFSENIREEIHSSILAYRELVKDAKVEFIKHKRFEMVLCTTSVTASFVMTQFKIVQVIIDEAGMCKEPETLIPISSAEDTVENVVLIGDHKQLRPIIHNKVANKRGLQISLFERYQELRPELVTMLNFQYRMHPSICEFPSKYFYSGRLKTIISNLWSGLSSDDMKYDCPYHEWNGINYHWCQKHYKSILKNSGYDAIPNDKWPGQRALRYTNFFRQFDKYPERIVFIHVIGDEIIQSITTGTGNENSRGNKVEVEAVGSVYRKIIERLDPPRTAPKFITVLTQYKLQQHLLDEKCKEILRKKRIKVDPIVKTVIRSQGSENDYIIFSTVRSLRNKEDINHHPTPGWERQYLGFITDANQINVALTRAKKGLIIIGNKNLLQVNNIWKKLINDLEKRNCVIEGCLDFPD